MDDARVAFVRALDISGDLVDRDPDNLEWVYGLGRTYAWLGFLHFNVGEDDAALVALERYLAVANGLVVAEPSNLRWQEECGRALNNMAAVYGAIGQTDSMIATIEQAAKAVQMSPEYLRRLARRGHLRGAFKVGRSWRRCAPRGASVVDRFSGARPIWGGGELGYQERVLSR